jgi:TRAP-type C4-dicarboxylate transport system substrate-binding protein
MHRRAFLIGSAGAVGAIFAPHVARAQQEIRLTIISGHPPAAQSVGMIRDRLVPGIDKRLAQSGKYKINWTQAYAGTVAKPPGVLKAIEDGVGDMGHTPHLFNADRLPLEQITYAAPFGPENPVQLAAIVKKLHERVPEMEAAIGRFKQIVLARIPTDRYHIVSKNPMAKVSDFAGVKLGTAGVAASWIKNTGAVSVAGNLTTFYNSIQTGVYEGCITFETAVKDYKFYEIAPHINTVGFGAMHASMITFNANRWKSLPKEVQDAIREETADYEKAIAARYLDAGNESIAWALKHGGKLVEFSHDERVKLAKMLPNIAKEWAADAEKRGLPGTKVLKAYMEIVREAGITPARDWDKE